MPITNGGLGITKLTTFNKALLGKWLWRFGIEENRIWRRVVALKFGEEWGDGPLSWRSIQMGWKVFSKNVQYKVGVGDRVKF